MGGNVNGKRKDKQPETCHSTGSGDAHGSTDDWILRKTTGILEDIRKQIFLVVCTVRNVAGKLS